MFATSPHLVNIKTFHVNCKELAVNTADIGQIIAAQPGLEQFGLACDYAEGRAELLAILNDKCPALRELTWDYGSKRVERPIFQARFDAELPFLEKLSKLEHIRIGVYLDSHTAAYVGRAIIDKRIFPELRMLTLVSSERVTSDYWSVIHAAIKHNLDNVPRWFSCLNIVRNIVTSVSNSFEFYHTYNRFFKALPSTAEKHKEYYIKMCNNEIAKKKADLSALTDDEERAKVTAQIAALETKRKMHSEKNTVDEVGVFMDLLAQNKIDEQLHINMFGQCLKHKFYAAATGKCIDIAVAAVDKICNKRQIDINLSRYDFL
jgi:hypothetical protein